MSLSQLGTGSALPCRVVTNGDLAAFLDTGDEWIRTRTGIRRRRILSDGETVTGLAAAAAAAALQSAGEAAADVDYILCPTIGGDYITPSLASMVQAGIGAACPAMDLNAACSGFVYALETAAGLFALGRARRVLVVCAEGLSRVVDWRDRATAVLFGDGAAAVLLGPGEDLLYVHLTSQGAAAPLNMPYPMGNFPGRAAGGGHYLKMDGGEVYRFAVQAIAGGVAKALAATRLSANEIAYVLMHQANGRILEAACKKLGIAEDKCPVVLDEVGNVSAVSIPLIMDGLARGGRLSAGDLMVLSAFGGGLTTGTAVLRWGGQK